MMMKNKQQQQQQQQQQSKSILPLHKSSNDSPSSLRRITHRHNSGGSTNSAGKQQQQQQHHEDDSHHASSLLPTWSANPQSPVEDTNNANATPSSPRSSPTSHLLGQYHGGPNDPRPYYYAMVPSRRCLPRGCCGSWSTLLGSVLLGVGIAMAWKSRASLMESMDHLTSLVHNGQLLQEKLLAAKKGIKTLHRQVSAYDVLLQQQQHQQQQQQQTLLLPHDNNPPMIPVIHNQALQEMQQLDARLQESQKRADRLKKQVQALSKKEALERYGDHVHRVEIELTFPDQRPGPTKFIIELAPLDVMPHSVHFFLEMVQSGLLDGCSFILNALHVLKAAPLPYDGSSAANKARAFARVGLESVAFKEYDSRYPHQQYTVGFAADGSPSFYINTEDNSEIHWGDPCFGRIVEGFDTVKRLEASPTRNGIWFEQRIGIHRATVLL
jgi:cyclophilin family peptidyl-prolyl cis-trans isomerase